MGVHSQPTASRTTMKSSSNLRGQLGTRSGPLSPTSSKLTTQYLVLDHMTNHYSKITKAKPAIDNKPPKSMTTSQKARDRKTRDYISKTGSRPPSSASVKTRSRPHTGMGYYDDDLYNEQLWGEVDPEDEEDRLAYEIMRTTLKGQEHGGQGYSRPVHIPGAGVGGARRPSSARSVGSVTSARNLQTVPQKGTYSGDVLNKRAHVFTEEKPFTPRTLKTDRVSRLSQYKYYNKPPPKEGQRGSRTQDAASPPKPASQQNQEMVEGAPRPQPRPRPRKPSAQTLEGTATENSLTFESLRTRDFRKFEDRDQVVPPLDISLDTDQMKYIKNQGSKPNDLSRNDTLKTTTGTVEGDGTYGSIDFGKTGEMSLTYGTLPDSKARTLGTKSLISSQRISQEDEDGKYVDFVKAVTNDVLNRGIYTDRALSQVFEAHIKQRRGELDEFRMREMINQIRADLGVPRTDSLGANEYHLHISEMDDTLGSTIQPRPDHLMAHSPNPQSKDSSTYESPDSLQFRSTDEVYSTIHSEIPNGTLSDTQALRSYQMTISQQDMAEESEGEIIEGSGSQPFEPSSRGSVGEMDAPQVNGNDTYKPPPESVITVEAEIRNHPTPPRSESLVEQETEMQNKQQTQPHVIQVAERNGVKEPVEGAIHSRPGSSRVPSSRTSAVDEEEEYGDDEYEDDYDDEEEEDTVNETTEPTATYRTDDDDF